MLSGQPNRPSRLSSVVKCVSHHQNHPLTSSGSPLLADVCDMLDKERKVMEDLEARTSLVREISAAASQVCLHQDTCEW